MDEREFERLAEEALFRVERMLEANGIDFEWLPGRVLEIDCAEGGPVVIHRHLPSQELWVASRSGGFHYRHDEGLWRDTRDGRELFAFLSRLIGAQAGAPLF
ncbi:MAG: frataxin-like protein [Betaproteobacteria bacterium ADurb.Bin341]|nr:MAG: frataxin-like protein [Betaproteobacteria bacterium ADurb.Bin341]